MEILRVVLTCVFVLICIALTIIVLRQEGKTNGLSALAGGGETYWDKNKGRSFEGKLAKFTTILAVAFLIIAVILNINF